MTRLVVPARQGKGIPIPAGRDFKIINTHGSQVLDTWAFAKDDTSTYLSMAHTRSYISRIYIQPGDMLVDNFYEPMLEFLEDTSPGVHDTLMCSCSMPIYRRMGCTDYHDNCEDNLHSALHECGLKATHTPAPLNLFMNYPVDPVGAISREPPVTKPGDYVLFRAKRDIMVVVSACPQDLIPINGVDRKPSEAHLELL